MTKCPQCKKSISYVRIERMAAKDKVDWLAMALVCPLCSEVLGVQIDPFCMADRTARTTASALGIPG
jgi:hypothetical protein